VRNDVPVSERVKEAIAFGQAVMLRYSSVGGSIVAGGLSFYVFFALAPTALAIGALAGAFLTQKQVQTAVQEIFDRSPETLKSLEPTTKALVELADRGTSSAFTITTIVSFFVAVYVASRVVYGLRATLTRIFGAPDRVHGVVDRGFSAFVALGGMVTVVALLLVLQLLPRILDELGLSDVLRLVGVRVVNWTVLSLVAFTICGLVLKFLPDTPTRLKVRSWGVLFATLWMLGSSAVFGLYTSLSNTVGAAIVAFGTPIVLMLWFYLVFMGILIGGAIEAQIHGAKAPPRPAPIQWPHWVKAAAAKVGIHGIAAPKVPDSTG
jgi:YihY family inner membrane protein